MSLVSAFHLGSILIHLVILFKRFHNLFAIIFSVIKVIIELFVVHVYAFLLYKDKSNFLYVLVHLACHLFM